MTDMYRPRRASEIVDASVQLYRQHARAFLITGAVVFIPLLLLRTVVIVLFGVDPDGEPNNDAASIFMSVLDIVFFLLVSAALTVAADRAYTGAPPGVRESFAGALPKLGAFIVASILSGLLVLVGIVLLIIPGFYFYGKFGLAPTVALLESRDGLESMRRASKLSEDRKRHILAAIVATWLIFFAVMVGAAALAWAIPTTSAFMILEAVVNIFAYPLVPIALVITYYDLRIRAEGYDIELLERYATTPLPEREPAG